MRRPASITQFPAYPIAGGLGLMAVIVTLMSTADKSHGSIDALTMNALAFWDEPWRLVTSALPHGDAFHLIFNVYWMWSFGTVVEETFGHVATFLLVIALQIGSGAAEYAFLDGGIGLSGVGFGLLGFLWVLSRRDPRFAGALDTSTLHLFAVWFVFCCIVTVLDVWHVANIAHAMGFVLGIVLGDIVSRGRLAPRLAGGVLAAALVGGSLLGASFWRPHVNLGSAGADSARLGYVAATEGRMTDAIRHYRRALELDPKLAGTWFNLGLSLQADQPDESIAAFREAHRLVVDEEFADTLRDATFKRAQQLAPADCVRAVPLYRESIAVGGERPVVLYNLAVCLDQLGERDEAKQLRRRALALDPKLEPRR